MKRYGSIWMLAAQNTLWKLLLIWALTFLAELGLIVLAMGRLDYWDGLEYLVSESHAALAAGAGLLATCGVLALNGCDGASSRSRYTLRRLRVDERTLTLCWGGHNALCLLVFWGAQAAWALFLCRFAMAHAVQTPFNDMSLFLAFFRNGFLHSLLPLQEYSRAIRNGIFLLCLGLTAACFSYQQRHGRRGFAILPLSVLTVVSFSQGFAMAETDIALSAVALFTAAGAVWNVWRYYEDEA